MPGASTLITIRGVSSISSSNQPLMIVDGLPIDNKTINTGVLAPTRRRRRPAFSNRGVDFTNRAADINPEDIEIAHGAQGTGSRGALRHRCGERRDRHHDEARTQWARVVSTTATASASSRCAHSRRSSSTFGPSGTLSIGGSGYGSYGTSAARMPPNTRPTTTSATSSSTGATQKHNLSFSDGTADNRLTTASRGSSTQAGRRHSEHGLQPHQPDRSLDGRRSRAGSRRTCR